MPRFSFTIGGPEGVRHAGTVHGQRFEDAIHAISDKVDSEHGDTLEIGVAGFPPARYTRIISNLTGDAEWRPAVSLAA